MMKVFLLILLVVFLSACSEDQRPNKIESTQSEKENPALEQELQAQEELKQDSANDVILLRGTQKLKNGADMLELEGATLVTGGRVLNLAINQYGTATGDIVILLKGNDIAPAIEGLEVVESGNSMVRYRAKPSTDLLLALKKLQSESSVTMAEIQVDYTPIGNSSETM